MGKDNDFIMFLHSILLPISMFLIIGYWVLVWFVGFLYCFLQHQNPNHTSNYLCGKSSAVVEMTQTLSGKWILEKASHLLSRCKKLGLRWILLDRTRIRVVEQAVYRPNTAYPDAFSTSACMMQNVGWSSQALADLSDLLHGIHGCKEYLLLEIFVHVEEECLFFLPQSMLDRFLGSWFEINP